MLIVVLLAGCSPSRERIVRITNGETSRPVTNATFMFFEDAPFAPLVKAPAPVTGQLDRNGEVRFRFPGSSGWARFDEEGTPHGTSLKKSDVANGGRFRLYRPPPKANDTNIYVSKYVLEIRKL